jgi:hypothetical protein
MRYEQLISKRNLTLAWLRIMTARNMQYKRFFRPLFLSYEIAHEDCISRLHDRLMGRWQPARPVRVFLPKASGLQRPVALLALDDQIVLQAVANAFADRLRVRRLALEGHTIFSNLLETPGDSKFFIQDWHKTFVGFQDKCLFHFSKGLRWVAHFDLAAFYDTISHQLLLKNIAPRDGHSRTWAEVREWLSCWSCTEDGEPFHHGIPQGPVASDFLAEAFLLPLDEALSRERVRYVRYVDDIRIFARTKLEAQKAAVRLEVLCRALGLIPQGRKFTVLEASSLDEVLGQLPSLAPPGGEDDERQVTLSASRAETLLRRAVGGRPSTVREKSTLRYVMYRAPRSRRILGIVLRLLPRYPEHIDAFAAFLSIYTRSRAIEKSIGRLLQDGTPYDYVRAEIWQLLAGITSRKSRRRLLLAAQRDIGGKGQALWLKFGALSFLLASERWGVGACLGRLRYQPALVQALLVPSLPDMAYDLKPLIAKLLRSPTPEPGLMLGSELAARRRTHLDYGVRTSELAPDVQRLFRALRLLRRPAIASVDQVGEILERRFGAPGDGWRAALGGEYVYGLRLLVQGDALFEAGRSQWLQLQNSFNDALTRAIIEQLVQRGLPGAATLVGRDNKLVKFGNLLQLAAPFSRAHPAIAAPFREANDRRNRLPSAHPYDEKRGKRNRHLSAIEQRGIVQRLGVAYAKVVSLASTFV